MVLNMARGYLSSTNRYKRISEEEREKLRIQMSENYYKKTENKVKKRKTTPQKFVKNPNQKNRSPYMKK